MSDQWGLKAVSPKDLHELEQVFMREIVQTKLGMHPHAPIDSAMYMLGLVQGELLQRGLPLFEFDSETPLKEPCSSSTPNALYAKVEER